MVLAVLGIGLLGGRQTGTENDREQRQSRNKGDFVLSHEILLPDKSVSPSAECLR